jgi:translocation and assembly module TamB
LTHFIRRIAATFCFILLAGSLAAQDDDKGFLTNAIQNALSGSGRTVSIDGFQGALSSRASFDRMTIADDQGIWLTLEEVQLDWNRSALLRGRLEVESLTAQRLDLPRLPVADPTVEIPDAEAKPFALPDLPVSINVADFSLNEISLGQPILGEAAVLTLNADAQFNDDVAAADITAQRIDGKRGELVFRVNLDRSADTLDLLLTLDEAPEGIAAKLMNLPDDPEVKLTVAGNGPLDSLVTDINLSTDGTERLAGQVTLGTQTPENGGSTPDRRIQANLGGDVTALMVPQYRDFFGENIQLSLDALLRSNGAVEVSAFNLDSRAAQIEGRVSLTVDKWPSFIDITGTVANTDQSRVLLPVGGADTFVQRVALDVQYDAADGDALNANFDITGLSTDAAAIDRTQLALTGTLQGAAGAAKQFDGDVTFEAIGLALTDSATAEALGDAINGSANVSYTEGQPVRISALELTGTDYGLQGEATIAGSEERLRTDLQISLQAQDISRFSGLAGRELDGAAELSLGGTIVPLDRAFDLTINGATDDIKLGIEQADAVLAGRTQLSLGAQRDESGTFIRDLSLSNAAITATGAAELRTDNSRVNLDASLTDIALVAPQYAGPVTVRVDATQDTQGWTVDADTDGPYGAAITVQGLATGPDANIDFTAAIPEIKDFLPDAPVEGRINAIGKLMQTPEGWRIDTSATAPENVTASVQGLVTPTIDIAFDASVPDVSPFVPQVEGAIRARGQLTQTADGYQIDTNVDGPYDARVAVQGALTPMIDISFDAAVPDVNPLVPQVNGRLRATGQLQQTADGFQIDTNVDGPYAAKVAVQGALTPMIDIRFDAAVPNVNPLVPQVNGPLNATGTLRQTDQGFFIDTNATGPYGAQAAVEGLATGPDMSLNFNLSVPNVQPLVPGVSGSFAVSGSAQQTPNGIAVDTNINGPYASRASVQGTVTGASPAIDFNVAIPNIGALVPDLVGPLNVTGSARQQGEAWQLQTDLSGLSGTQASVSGTVGTNGNLDLDISGNAPLGLSAPFIAPRSLQGTARFDLSVNGPPELGSVTGTIQTSDARLFAPNLRLGLEGIGANIRLGNNRAQIDLQATGSEGGRLQVGGAITLTGSLPADIQIGLDNLVLQDPSLYRTSLSGQLRLAGPLLGGAQISGQINVGETNVTVPSTGLTSIGDIPPIDFVGAPRDVIATRRRAGLDGANAGDDPAGGASGPGFGLNIRINAPNRIFVRGRGLDTELGGGLTLTGSTNQIISAGRFDLLRGRLDILGKRFDLTEGSIQFQGDLVPYIRFVTATSVSDGQVRVVVDGPANDPVVSFESTPDKPQDEVLAQLLFGRNISEISAFQALQLASAVATLAGRGGGGIISGLRDGFGLDDLDVTTTDDGATAVRAGKYLSENLYTDVTAASDGTAEISLNLDITTSLKAKGTVGSDGNTGIGIFFERDY